MIALPGVIPGAGAPNDETRYRSKNRIFQDCSFFEI
ncbi:unnamed protein product, partial [Ectocarpus sp. 13 AM-2016]